MPAITWLEYSRSSSLINISSACSSYFISRALMFRCALISSFTACALLSAYLAIIPLLALSHSAKKSLVFASASSARVRWARVPVGMRLRHVPSSQSRIAVPLRASWPKLECRGLYSTGRYPSCVSPTLRPNPVGMRTPFSSIHLCTNGEVVSSCLDLTVMVTGRSSLRAPRPRDPEVKLAPNARCDLVGERELIEADALNALLWPPVPLI
mmetsp:Transcript_28230/g.76333  ORF Transcript_28230/g.76333 Transcript_28230/m.76333 type:complete len:211 (+) Transcript_28230:200-832(+)